MSSASVVTWYDRDKDQATVFKKPKVAMFQKPGNTVKVIKPYFISLLFIQFHSNVAYLSFFYLFFIFN